MKKLLTGYCGCGTVLVTMSHGLSKTIPKFRKGAFLFYQPTPALPPGTFLPGGYTVALDGSLRNNKLKVSKKTKRKLNKEQHAKN